MTERLTEKIVNKETGEILAYRLKGTYAEYLNNRLKALQKLGELETAEEDGRLVVLPCKPGITLYILRKKYTKCSKHNEEFDESSCCGCEDECDSRLFYYIVPCPDVTAEQILEFERLGALNKKVFFSKEEAEKALKEMEGK